MVSERICVGKKDLILETGKIAKQADGAVLVQYGETVVMAAVVASTGVREGTDFFPLTVDYRERASASGKFPGGYFKREGRPTEKEILTCRLVDRPIRPLFPDGFFNEVQVSIIVLSADAENDPDVLSIVAASAALHISSLPFKEPVGAVRVGLVNDQLIINPTYEEITNSDLDLVVAGTASAIIMVEGRANQISEEKILEALKFGHDAIKEITKTIEKLRENAGKSKIEPAIHSIDQDAFKKISSMVDGKLKEVIQIPEKRKREEAKKSLLAQVKESILQEDPEADTASVSSIFEEIEKKKMRRMIVDDGVRNDGRTSKQIRPITCDLNVLPRTHGSALFTRGETQALVIATLGTSKDEQKMEGYEGETYKRFMLHYNFPSFSVGEVRPSRGPGRREIGHGALAERALLYIIPNEEKFPYTVRIVSDITESNGSSSMATVCGGTLAMMDAGVPITAPVAGIAMGLIQEEDKTVILSDILGSEDHLGDMDFKVAGTEDGITAFQMDVKIGGIDNETLTKALDQAKEGRLHILNIMKKAIDKPRENLSEFAPKIKTIFIPTEKIGLVIGPSGKNIKRIIEETGASIDIEDDGRVMISGSTSEGVNRATQIIEEMTQDVEIGKIYQGTVKNILDFGCFVEVLPGKEGLVHISQLADHRVNKVDDVVKIGDQIKVKVLEIDSRGRINLSRKAVLASESSLHNED
ncbi:MAG: polyribonucleotide nucleotidyltransferase [Chlamydiota bacterium]|nr:polyribonucleotide nucleotidyltransferase [Chlamydiota bacterium]